MLAGSEAREARSIAAFLWDSGQTSVRQTSAPREAWPVGLYALRRCFSTPKTPPPRSLPCRLSFGMVQTLAQGARRTASKDGAQRADSPGSPRPQVYLGGGHRFPWPLLLNHPRDHRARRPSGETPRAGIDPSIRRPLSLKRGCTRGRRPNTIRRTSCTPAQPGSSFALLMPSARRESLRVPRERELCGDLSIRHAVSAQGGARTPWVQLQHA